MPIKIEIIKTDKNIHIQIHNLGEGLVSKSSNQMAQTSFGNDPATIGHYPSTSATGSLDHTDKC